MNQKFFSVVVCAYNEEKLLHLCLEGLISQTYPYDRYEVVVVDDESTDRTFTIASDFIANLTCNSPRIRLVRIKHGGLSVARNTGIKLSDGDPIAFIDGDAVPNATWLEELAKPFMQGADFAGGRINLLNTDSLVARFLQLTRHRQFFGPRIFYGQFVGCNMAFRKEVFDTVGGFQENFVSRGDESTLLTRIVERFNYAPAPNAVVLHERPDTVADSIFVEWKSATLSSLCNKASGIKMQWRSTFLIIEQFLIMLFPIFFCLVWFAPVKLGLPMAISTLAVIRRLYVRRLNWAIAKGLVQKYGLLRGTIAHVVFCYAFDTLGLIGRMISPWLHRNAKIIPPMTTAVKVLNMVDSRAGNSHREKVSSSPT